MTLEHVTPHRKTVDPAQRSASRDAVIESASTTNFALVARNEREQAAYVLWPKAGCFDAATGTVYIQGSRPGEAPVQVPSISFSLLN